MAWQIHTLTIGGPHVGARVQAKAKWRARRRPIVSGATRSGFLLAFWLRGFTFSLPVHFEVLTSKEDCGRWIQQQRGACRGARRGDGGGAISGTSRG